MFRSLVLFVASAALLAGCSSIDRAEAAPEEKEPKKRLIRAKPFPEEARRVLSKRMLSHGSDMESLLWATVQLDYKTTSTIAKRIASASRISRPTSGPQDPLLLLLPDDYFVLQDQLQKVAFELADAATKEQDLLMASSYGRLTKTCITCHSLYLRIESPAK